MTEYPSKNATPPTEAKVKAATYGAGAGVAVAELLTWALDNYLITPNVVGDLPAPVSVAVPLLIAAGLAWYAGYRAKHTPRPSA
jgi:high-affinity Fe2+/Pb2+ permease